MAQTDTTGLAHCENDETVLRKMQEELDAAAEFIVILSEQLEQNNQSPGAPAEEHIDPRERADRAALLQTVYHLSEDNPGLSLSDALVYLSGVFGGTQPTAPDSQPDLQEEASPFTLPELAADPDVLPEETSATGAIAQGTQNEEGDHFEQLIVQAQHVPWNDSTLIVADESLPSFEELLPPPQDPPAPQEEPQADPQDTSHLPQPMSAAEALGERAPSAPPLPQAGGDEEWDPMKFVAAPNPTKQLDELLKEVEIDREDEIYGIKAFAKEHPELFETPPKAPKQVLKKKR